MNSRLFPRSQAICSLAVALLISTCAAPSTARAEINFQSGDTVLFYGNSLVERLNEHGDLEALVQLAHPDKRLRFRSFAWTGDEIGYRLRPEGYEEHLKSLLAQWPAQIIIVGFGMNEAFAGPSSLPDFRSQLASYLDQLARLHPRAQFVLLSPTAIESGFPEQDHLARNRDLTAYTQAIRDAASARAALFVDLFSASQLAYSQNLPALTVNGLHLNDEGNRLMARVIARSLLGETPLTRINPQRVSELAKAVTQKSYFVGEVVRPKNADLYYGVRKRPEEYAAEIPRYHQMIAATEAIIHELARSPERSFASFSTPWLAPMPPGKGKDDGKNTGIIKPPAEQQAEFKVAPGFSVNLFASEVQFPELRNPVQIAFDAQGRLWVVTMPSFPHTVPGLPPEDKLLILEDTNHDGVADKCTTFAHGFDALDGVAFSESGVIVSEQPRLWLMNDTNGDGKADTKHELLRGIDVTDSHHGGMIATDPIGHVLFCDGVFHRSQIETPFGVVRGIDSTTYRLNPRTGRVETEWQSITPNPWKITIDRTGNYFQMYGDGLVLDALPLTWTPLAIYHPFAYAKTVGYGKGSAAAVISSPNFPDAYQQGMASAALLGSYTVSLTQYNFDQGMVRGSGRLDVVTSTNAAFRPADVAFGFDGALYISDFCSAIIGHAQHPMRDPHWDHDHGRIWRAVHTAKPLVKQFPRIEGQSLKDLLPLLHHSQDIVRHHVRIELRKSGLSILPALDQWIASLDRTHPHFDQSALEILFITEGLGQTRPALLAELLKSKSDLHRAAAVRMIRFQASRLADPGSLLHQMAADPHPRVQMEVVDAVAHLRPTLPAIEHALHALHSDNDDVNHMLADLAHGTKPAKGRSVPVLEFNPQTRLNHWLFLGVDGASQPLPYEVLSSPAPKPANGLYRTFLTSDLPQSAVLAVHYGFLDIAVNGIPLLSFDSMWSNDQQVQLNLPQGLSVIDITFRNLRGAPPAVHLFDPIGSPLPQAVIPQNISSLLSLAAEFEQLRAKLGTALRVLAVPGKLEFSPRELHVKARSKVRLVFENPDLMIHNLVIVAPGTEEEVGLLADQLATQPDALAKEYVPASDQVLHATPLVQPRRSAELIFDAPSKPGRYPFICTFPGHWRLMRGVLVVTASP